MTPVETGLIAQLALAAVAVVAAVVTPPGRRSLAAGAATVLLALAGAATGAAAMTGGTGAIRLPVALPLLPSLDPLMLAPDRLGGLFMLVAGAVGAVAALFAIGYAAGPVASRTGWSAFAVFLLGMQLVPAAGDVVSFLLAWELMAVGSAILVLTEHRKHREVRSAALWYTVMTHLSFLLLLAGFAVLAAASGRTDFAAIGTAGIGGSTAGLAFVLLSLGFVTKAGLVPVHVWLPRAHPAAPSHVSAVMSAAMVKMGIYGVLLVVLRLLPGGPGWWGVLLLTLGALSALYGILQASVANDLKRLLAYSTTENVGLIITAVAISMLLRRTQVTAVADVALVAALLLVVSHAAFKTVLFLGAGAVQQATGERDLDRLGGLSRTMPATSAAFGVACMGAAALPVTSGFVAEWVLLQALIHGGGRQNRLVAVAMPITVAIVALTAGLALLTFVKAYGIGFLARPRSEGAARAHEVGWPMRAAMTIGAVAVVVLGLAPGPLAVTLARVVGAHGIESTGLLGLDLPAVGALLDPVALGLLAVGLAVPLTVVAVRAARRRPRRLVELPWGGGGIRVSPRMQYTATSYAEPLVRVFDDALQPTRDLEVSHAAESRYLVNRVQFRQSLSDVVEDRVYRPAIAFLNRVGERARGVQNGSIHRYLGFSFAALTIVLVVVTW